MNIKRAWGLLAALGLCGSAYAAPVINSNRQRVTLSLRGGDFVVNGNNNFVQLRGKCGTLTVNGNRNVIVTNELVRVVANGNHNKVTWKKGAQVSNLGNSNTIRRAQR